MTKNVEDRTMMLFEIWWERHAEHYEFLTKDEAARIFVEGAIAVCMDIEEELGERD